MMKNSTCGHSYVVTWKLARDVNDITWSAPFRTIRISTVQTLPTKKCGPISSSHKTQINRPISITSRQVSIQNRAAHKTNYSNEDDKPYVTKEILFIASPLYYAHFMILIMRAAPPNKKIKDALIMASIFPFTSVRTNMKKKERSKENIGSTKIKYKIKSKKTFEPTKLEPIEDYRNEKDTVPQDRWNLRFFFIFCKRFPYDYGGKFVHHLNDQKAERVLTTKVQNIATDSIIILTLPPPLKSIIKRINSYPSNDLYEVYAKEKRNGWETTTPKWDCPKCC